MPKRPGQRVLGIFSLLNIVIFFIFSPGRFAGTELIRSDDDLYILQVAKELEGIISVSAKVKTE